MSDNLKSNKALKWLSLSGVLAFAAYFCMDLIGSTNYPGYDWMNQAVSDLTALDSLQGLLLQDLPAPHQS